MAIRESLSREIAKIAKVYLAKVPPIKVYLIGEKFVGLMFRRLKYFVSYKSFVKQENIRHFSPTKTFNQF